jgi:hypothetical protein
MTAVFMMNLKLELNEGLNERLLITSKERKSKECMLLINLSHHQRKRYHHHDKKT